MKSIVCGAALALLVVAPASATDATGQPKACSWYLDLCLAKVRHAAETAQKLNRAPDPIYPGPGVCYAAADQAKSSGVWPRMGATLPARCSS